MTSESIDFYRLFEALPHPYLIVRADASFTIVAANERCLQASGTERSRIMGRPLFEVFPDNLTDSSDNGVSDLRQSLERVLRDRSADVMGVQKCGIPARNDSDRRFRVKYWSPINTPVVEADGSVSHIIHHVEEVTEFVLAHERDEASAAKVPERIEARAAHMQAEVSRRARELEYTNRQIKASEARLARMNEQLQELTRMKSEAELRQAATVFTATGDGVIIADADRRIVAVNQAFTRIAGFEPSEVIGQNPRVLQSGRHDPAFYEALWQKVHVDGHWQGEIWNRRKSGEIYPAWESISAVKNERKEIVSYVAVFSDITSIKATEERLARLAHQDNLTGLPNRLLLTERLTQALGRAKRHRRRGALILLDLDRFKLINDTRGHAAGDRLLRAVAERLQTCVRSEDTVARLGGDEFVILLPEIAGPQEAALVVKKILVLLDSPISLDGEMIVTSASFGISLFPDDADDGEALLKAADTAMYRAKQRGRHGLAFYAPDLTTEAGEFGPSAR